MSTYIPEAPLENVNRGTAFAALAIPVGIIAWVIIWSIGFIASIVGFAVAALAVWLYRKGSGGRITRAGAVRVLAIVLVTMVVAIIAGLITDVALAISRAADISPIDALGYPKFGQIFNEYLTTAGAGLWFSIALAVVFGFVGCFSILRGAFREARVTEAPTAPAAWPTITPQNPTTENPIAQNPTATAPEADEQK